MWPRRRPHGLPAMPAFTSAQAPPGATITVQEQVQTVAQDDVAPKSRRGRVSVGDRLITRQSLFDASKQRLGTLYTDCTRSARPPSLAAPVIVCPAARRACAMWTAG
ncbi:MAG: hypothetical protein M3N47_11715 [Chloroflexota bacterium]|nr:hypothetical protein [Chloroflexota bacterium]